MIRSISSTISLALVPVPTVSLVQRHLTRERG
jgi:hypothetical protein